MEITVITIALLVVYVAISLWDSNDQYNRARKRTMIGRGESHKQIR